MDEFDKIEQDFDEIDFNKKIGKWDAVMAAYYGKVINRLDKVEESFIDFDEEQLLHGVPMSELSVRQTGRTTRMLLFIAEAVRRAILNDEQKIFLVVTYNIPSSRFLISQLGDLLSKKFKFVDATINTGGNYSLKIDNVKVVTRSYKVVKDGRVHGQYDDVFIDPSCFDREMRNIKVLLNRSEPEQEMRGRPSTRPSSNRINRNQVREWIMNEFGGS